MSGIFLWKGVYAFLCKILWCYLDKRRDSPIPKIPAKPEINNQIAAGTGTSLMTILSMLGQKPSLPVAKNLSFVIFAVSTLIVS